MAPVRSLGVYQSSALEYLVAESILPPEPSPSSYQVRYQHRFEHGSNIHDEVLTTRSCVVWSRNGTIERVFNLDIEVEPISHAFVTTFISQKESVSTSSQAGSGLRDEALVVILKTQAHVNLVSGDHLVLPLNFEVQHAFPCARGFLVQRKLDEEPISEGIGRFAVNRPHHDSIASLSAITTPRPSTLESALAMPTKKGTSRTSRLPRTYAYTELLSELSLVVAGSARKTESLDKCSPLPINEKVIYVSCQNEIHQFSGLEKGQVLIAVTLDQVSGAVTLWQILYRSHYPDQKPAQAIKPTKPSKRKSSNVYGRHVNVTGPGARGPTAFRESFGGPGQPPADTISLAAGLDQLSKKTDLAAQLGHEFEQGGVQTRSARRVSSMLARTELGAAGDRGAFNDLALGTVSRKSLSRSIRRGESLGGLSDRQSFGRRRSSFQAGSSIMSDGTSFLDIPVSHLLDDGPGLHASTSANVEDEGQLTSQLPRDVGFMKLKTLQFDTQSHPPSAHHGLEVITILAPDRSTADERRSRILSVCIMDRQKQDMTIVNVAIRASLASYRSPSGDVMYELRAVEVRQNQPIVDACKLGSAHTERLLTLTKTRDERHVLQLEAPWSPPFQLALPLQFRRHDSIPPNRSTAQRQDREPGLGWTIPLVDIDISEVRCHHASNQFALVEKGRCSHIFQVQMVPQDQLIRQIIGMTNLVLPPEQHDSLLVVYWEIYRWLQDQNECRDLEWSAMTIAIFTLAVPFITDDKKASTPGGRKRKVDTVRSGSATTTDLDSWTEMLASEAAEVASWQKNVTWLWCLEPKVEDSKSKIVTKAFLTASRTAARETGRDNFLIRCANLAREFLQSPAGEIAMGPEGYLPTAVNIDRDLRRTAIAKILVGLHILREEAKLYDLPSCFEKGPQSILAGIIVQLAQWLHWSDWRLDSEQYYHFEAACYEHYQIENSAIDSLETPRQPFAPPSIFTYCEESLRGTRMTPFPSLLVLIAQLQPMSSSHPLWKEAARLTPRLFAMDTIFGPVGHGTTIEGVANALFNAGISRTRLGTIPDGIAFWCQQVVANLRQRPSTSQLDVVSKFIGRDDGMTSQLADGQQHVLHTAHFHGAVRDHRSISNNALDADATSRWDVSMEADRHEVTRMIFNQDRRFQEASKLLNQTRPPMVECVPDPDWSDGDLLDAQKELAQFVTKRTFSVTAGRGMMYFNAKVPLLTERVPIPAFNLQCIMKASNGGNSSQLMTFSADKNLFTEDKTSWAFFHNGVAAGLMVSKEATWIDTSWILYNKPPELTNRHAGFLFALGLNGHLKALAKWVAFKYLTPKHTLTPVGLLLGLAASYRGTMNTLITRLLSVHVTRLLPVGAAELNLSPLTQASGLVGIGLLYHSSQHRRMSEAMISEIENNEFEEKSGDEPILRDEGYRLAAGFALGLINLGQGASLSGLHDMSVVERLLAFAIGTKNVNMVHVLDRATAGSVVAIALIFMKTNERSVAKKIDVPDTVHQFDYVRPDIFLLRTLARHMIMWNEITPSMEFVRQSLPPAYHHRANLISTKQLSTDDLPLFNILSGICFAMSLRFAGSQHLGVRDLLVSFLDQFLRLSRLPALNYDSRVTLNGVRNCLDVLALSCATVMAGSGDLVVLRRLRALHGRVDKETPFGSHMAAHMAIGALFLSGGTATFGTSDLAIACLVIAFYPVFPTEMLDNRGHLQALRHLWVLAAEERCLTARDAETNLVIPGIEAELHMVDSGKVKAKTPCLVPELGNIQSITFNHDSYWPISIEIPAKASDRVLPQAPDHGPPNDRKLNVLLKRRSTYEKAENRVFESELRALDEARGVPSADTNATVNEKWRLGHGGPDVRDAYDSSEWVFGLDALRGLDHSERALVLGSRTGHAGHGERMLEGSAVDTRLQFEHGTLGSRHSRDDDDELGPRAKPMLSGKMLERDKLWQLRLLFAAADRWEKEVDEQDHDGNLGKDSVHAESADAGSAQWLKKEFIERLRTRIWDMTNED